MINYSIIIPHKNTPGFLSRCLSSIPERSDTEVIIVDDNSSPGLVDFNDFPGSGDANIKVIYSKCSRGAGGARNIGLDNATGKWIIFVDADDYLLPVTSSQMDLYADSSFDVVFFKCTAVRYPSGSASGRSYEFNRRVDISLRTEEYSQPLLYSSPWGKFFKRELLEAHNIRFNEVRWGDDVVFMGRIAKYAESFASSDSVIYCITESDNSNTKDVSLLSKVVRFQEESENVGILKHTPYSKDKSIWYWYFMTWFDIWKINKGKALSLIPKAIVTSKGRFMIDFFKAALHI